MRPVDLGHSRKRTGNLITNNDSLCVTERSDKESMSKDSEPEAAEWNPAISPLITYTHVVLPTVGAQRVRAAVQQEWSLKTIKCVTEATV